MVLIFCLFLSLQTFQAFGVLSRQTFYTVTSNKKAIFCRSFGNFDEKPFFAITLMKRYLIGKKSIISV